MRKTFFQQRARTRKNRKGGMVSSGESAKLATSSASSAIKKQNPLKKRKSVFQNGNGAALMPADALENFTKGGKHGNPNIATSKILTTMKKTWIMESGVVQAIKQPKPK